MPPPSDGRKRIGARKESKGVRDAQRVQGEASSPQAATSTDLVVHASTPQSAFPAEPSDGHERQHTRKESNGVRDVPRAQREASSPNAATSAALVVHGSWRATSTPKVYRIAEPRTSVRIAALQHAANVNETAALTNRIHELEAKLFIQEQMHQRVRSAYETKLREQRQHFKLQRQHLQAHRDSDSEGDSADEFEDASSNAGAEDAGSDGAGSADDVDEMDVESAAEQRPERDEERSASDEEDEDEEDSDDEPLYDSEVGHVGGAGERTSPTDDDDLDGIDDDDELEQDEAGRGEGGGHGDDDDDENDDDDRGDGGGGGGGGGDPESDGGDGDDEDEDAVPPTAGNTGRKRKRRSASAKDLRARARRPGRVTWAGPSVTGRPTPEQRARGDPGIARTRPQMSRARMQWKHQVVREMEGWFRETFSRSCDAKQFASKDLWLEATKTWVCHLDKELGKQMVAGYNDRVVDATLKAVQKHYSAEAMHRIKSRCLISDGQVRVIVDELSKQFNESTRKWMKRPLGDIGVPLQKDHHLPQFASKRKIKKLTRLLTDRLGLEFTSDGTLATINPHVRLQEDVLKALTAGLIHEGDTLR